MNDAFLKQKYLEPPMHRPKHFIEGSDLAYRGPGDHPESYLKEKGDLDYVCYCGQHFARRSRVADHYQCVCVLGAQLDDESEDYPPEEGELECYPHCGYVASSLRDWQQHFRFQCKTFRSNCRDMRGYGTDGGNPKAEQEVVMGFIDDELEEEATRFCDATALEEEEQEVVREGRPTVEEVPAEA